MDHCADDMFRLEGEPSGYNMIINNLMQTQSYMLTVVTSLFLVNLVNQPVHLDGLTDLVIYIIKINETLSSEINKIIY